MNELLKKSSPDNDISNLPLPANELAKALFLKARGLRSSRRYDAAIRHYQAAALNDQRCATVFFECGVALADSFRDRSAVACFDRAIALNPRLPEAHFNKGAALARLGRLEAALASFDKGLSLAHAADWLGEFVFTSLMLCQWRDLQGLTDALVAEAEKGHQISPFALLAFCDDPAVIHRASENLARALPPLAASEIAPFRKTPPRDRIRIGYYSSDFFDHATCRLLAETFELHDKASFETIAFSYGPRIKDAMRGRVAKSFDKFIDVHEMSDADLVALSRDCQIDIAIDLKGHTFANRLNVFSGRCAPIQASYLGYPGTTAADFIDYMIADRAIVLEEDADFYSEKIVFLPNSYQPIDRKKKFGEPSTRRAEGLPEAGVVFCCFNNAYKIGPATFKSWMRILRAVAGSVLWLLESHPSASRNLRAEAEACGVSGKRLVFARKTGYGDHLSRQRLADLFLDTWPYNAHTTASDALWAGLPVLTLPGKSFAAKVGTSLLRAADMPELIASSPEDYERKAIFLGTRRDARAALKYKLKERLRTAPLFDTPLYTRNLETAYIAMWERYRAGLAPDHIYID